MMVNITAKIDQSHFKTIISNGRNELIADEPAASNGTDLGFSPSELLCSVLAACTSITLRMYADRKKWNLTDVKVQVSFETDTEKNISLMKRNIELIGDLTNEHRERLKMIADHCPIHKTLSNPIKIETRLT